MNNSFNILGEYSYFRVSELTHVIVRYEKQMENEFLYDERSCGEWREMLDQVCCRMIVPFRQYLEGQPSSADLFIDEFGPLFLTIDNQIDQAINKLSEASPKPVDAIFDALGCLRIARACSEKLCNALRGCLISGYFAIFGGLVR